MNVRLVVTLKSITRILKILIALVYISQLFIGLSLSSISADKGNDCFELNTEADILPYPFSRGSAVWVEDQQSIYIFAGRNETEILDKIMRYTPSKDKLTFLNTRLPNTLMGITAVYDNEYVYIFGGKDYDTFYSSILRFDPKSETISNMTALLPEPMVGSAAVWTGEYIYFFGGSFGGNDTTGHMKFDSILRYNTTADKIKIMNATLPYDRSGLAATWDGESENIYIVGGSDGKQFSDEIYKYSPESDKLTTLPGKLPTGRTHIQAQYHDGKLFIFGGRKNHTALLDDVVTYEIATDKVEIMDKKLTTPSELRMHAYDGENIYVIGGFNGPKNFNQFMTFYECRGACGCASCSDDPLVNPNWFFGVALVVLICAIIMNWSRNRKTK